MKIIIIIAVLLGLNIQVNAQKYFTRTGEISFFSSTSVEDIKADNKTITAIFDSQTGAIQFSVTMKSFHFEKALMEEHFNENYVESDQFPNATFSGKIENITSIDFQTNGTYQSSVIGKLTIHGVTKEIQAQATFAVNGQKIEGVSEIMVNPEDYKIEIPSIVREKIAQELKVSMKMNFTEKK